MDGSMYLEGSHEGWIIIPLLNGIQIISPGCGELEIERENDNTIRIIEQPEYREEK